MKTVQILTGMLTSVKPVSRDNRKRIFEYAIETNAARLVFEEIEKATGIKVGNQKALFKDLQNAELGFLEYGASKRGRDEKPYVAFVWNNVTEIVPLLQTVLNVVNGELTVSPEVLQEKSEVVIDWDDFRKSVSNLDETSLSVLTAMIDDFGTTVLAESIEKHLLVTRAATISVFEICQVLNLGVTKKGDTYRGKIMKPQFVWKDADTKRKASEYLRPAPSGISHVQTIQIPSTQSKIREEVIVNGKVIIFMADDDLDGDELDMVYRLMERKFIPANA